MAQTYNLHTICPELDSTSPVTLNGTLIGTITCCNVARLAEPPHLKYYGKAAVGAASGGSWDEPAQAIADVLAWHLHRPALMQESFYCHHPRTNETTLEPVLPQGMDEPLGAVLL